MKWVKGSIRIEGGMKLFSGVEALLKMLLALITIDYSWFAPDCFSGSMSKLSRNMLRNSFQQSFESSGFLNGSIDGLSREK